MHVSNCTGQTGDRTCKDLLKKNDSPLQGLDCTAMNKILSGLFSAKICPTKLCKQKKERKKESPCLHSDISKKKQGMFGMMSPEIKLLLWQV